MKIDIATVPMGIEHLENQLLVFSDSLLPEEVYSEKNLRLRVHSPDLPRYIMVHMRWHQGYCDLYRCLIGDHRESIPFAPRQLINRSYMLEKQIQCFRHATTIAGMCAIIVDMSLDSLVLDAEIAECAYQAGRILSLASASNAQGYHLTARETTEQTTRCLLMVKRLAIMYPILASMVCR